MADIDWNLHFARPTKPTVDSGGLADVAQLVMGGLAQRRAHQQRQAQEAEEKRRWEAENARKDAADRRAESLFQMQIEGRNEKTSGDIADLLAAGDVEGAQRRAATSSHIDPATGERSRIEFDRGGERFAPDMMPQARLSDPTEAEGSPLSPALKNAYPPIFGAGEKEAGGLELQGFAREMLGRLPEEGAPPAALPKRTVAPSFTAGGRRVEVDPNARTADLEQRSERLRAATAGADMPAGVRRMGDTLANLDMAEVDKADRASVVNALTQAQAQDARGDELEARLAMQEKLAAMRRKSGGGPKASDVRGDKRIAMQEETGARGLAKDVLGGLGYREAQAANRKFNDMAANLASDPNAAMDAVTAGSFVKMAQGGTGVISDADMKAFWDNIGGVPDKSAQWIEKVISGEINPEKRQKVLGAVSMLGRHAQAKLDEAEEAMTHAFTTSPNYSSYKDQMVGTYFPRARRRAAEAKGASTAKPKKKLIKVNGKYMVEE